MFCAFFSSSARFAILVSSSVALSYLRSASSALFCAFFSSSARFAILVSSSVALFWRSFVILLNCKNILLLSDLKIFFKFLHPPIQSVELSLSCQHLSFLGFLCHDLVDKLLSVFVIVNLQSAGFQ